MADSSPDGIKRYTPPVHRNRANNRRKSGEDASARSNRERQQGRRPGGRGRRPGGQRRRWTAGRRAATGRASERRFWRPAVQERRAVAAFSQTTAAAEDGALGWQRKELDRAEKANYSYNNDGEKSQVPSLKNLPPIIHHETFVSNAQNDYSQTRLVPLEGCCASEAAQLLSDRWAAAMNLCNDQSNDSPDKPVMYSGSSGSSWGHGHMKLPHQMNFLEDLRRAIDAQTGLAPAVNTRN